MKILDVLESTKLVLEMYHQLLLGLEMGPGQAMVQRAGKKKHPET